jgi:hypothetical protein
MAAIEQEGCGSHIDMLWHSATFKRKRRASLHLSVAPICLERSRLKNGDWYAIMRSSAQWRLCKFAHWGFAENAADLGKGRPPGR